MPAPLADEVTRLALRVIDFLLHEVDGLDIPIGSGDADPQPAGPAGPAVELPARIAVALTDGALERSADGRVIDMGVLARSSGVSERSLYTRWPTPADLKTDLFIESLERSRRAFARITLAFFQSHTSGTFTHTMPSMARMNAWFMDPERFPEATIHLGITEVLSEAAVLDRIRESVEVALENADVQSAALLLASGLRLRSDVPMRSYTMFSVGMGMGSHRTSATHPENLHRRLRYLGEEYLAAGVGHTAMTHSSTVISEPSAAADPRSVPPAPPALQPAPHRG
jgi:AcrR family transcriptional regulator